MPPMNQQDSQHRDFSLPPVAPGQRDVPSAPSNGTAVDMVDGDVVQETPTAFPQTPQS